MGRRMTGRMVVRAGVLHQVLLLRGGRRVRPSWNACITAASMVLPRIEGAGGHSSGSLDSYQTYFSIKHPYRMCDKVQSIAGGRTYHG